MVRIIAQLVADRQRLLRPAARIQHRIAIGRRVRHGLLTLDVLTRFPERIECSTGNPGGVTT